MIYPILSVISFMCIIGSFYMVHFSIKWWGERAANYWLGMTILSATVFSFIIPGCIF